MSFPIIIWSITGIFIIEPIFISDSVTSISWILGLTSPLGWLWITIMLDALSKNAYLNTSLGWTVDELSVPLNNSLNDISLDLVSRYNA